MTSPAPSPAKRRRPEWAGRNYTLLTTAAVITGVGSSSALIATSFAVLQQGGDGGDIGLVAAARTLPLVVFILIGGAVADRMPRHRVMVAANALNCVSQAAFALLVLTGTAELWQMMVLTALCGTGQAFFNPAAEGMLMSSVTPEQAGRAFSFFRMSSQGAGIGGAALGGIMASAVNPGWVLALDAAGFAIAGGLRAFLDVSHIPDREPGGGLLSDMREGWREFIGRPWLWSIVAQFSVVVAVVGAAESVYGPLVARDEFGGPGPWGTALATFGVGTLGGALLMSRWKPRRLLLAGTLGVFPLALPSAALAVPLPVAGLCVVMFVSGVAIEVFGVSWMTTMHQEIPEDKLSRVSAYDWFGSVAMLPLATAVAGPVEGLVGRSTALWGCAALVVVMTALVLLVPDVRNMTRREPTAPVMAGDPGSEDSPGVPAAGALPAGGLSAGVLAAGGLPAASSADAEGALGRLG
ncbi:MFS transporter [Streptomyces sp. NBC_00102]|uniref:MFS transporter n=1 Tax=Streptomyces sp. NBC_00102 TaxID=2975652 RepID=UPI002252C087|nr:MFS transporter [Streptomyces sp. NBC_00102]MCX5395478.1 MFS transporter [Streptomyces sp. NBC_00102]